METVNVCISEAVKKLEAAGWAKNSVKTIGENDFLASLECLRGAANVFARAAVMRHS